MHQIFADFGISGVQCLAEIRVLQCESTRLQQDILNFDDATVHIVRSTRWSNGRNSSALSGQVSAWQSFFFFILWWSEYMPSDTQLVEGVNNTLQAVVGSLTAKSCDAGASFARRRRLHSRHILTLLCAIGNFRHRDEIFCRKGLHARVISSLEAVTRCGSKPRADTGSDKGSASPRNIYSSS